MEALAKYGQTEISRVQDTWLNPKVVLEQVRRVTEIRNNVMKSEEHYGIIPGTSKPTLYKAGAEVLGLAFNLDCQFEETIDRLDGGHREYEVKCVVFNRATGLRLGAGVGSCSTLESKYRWRKAELTCPKCGKPAIIKGKAQYGGGWVCFAKKGGCGAKYRDDAPEIVNQPQGRIENQDIADMYNTVKKMAKKRAFVDAILTVTAASGMFTQDLEELEELLPADPQPEPVDVHAEPPRPPQPEPVEMMTAKQEELIKKLLLSHVWTQEEREKAEAWLDGHPTKDAASKFIERLMEKIPARKAEEAGNTDEALEYVKRLVQADGEAMYAELTIGIDDDDVQVVIDDLSKMDAWRLLENAQERLSNRGESGVDPDKLQGYWTEGEAAPNSKFDDIVRYLKQEFRNW
jgi:hypothetical protein